MFPLTADCYLKRNGSDESQLVGKVQFHMSESDHRRLEEAEEALQESGDDEIMLAISADDIELELPESVGGLSDCLVRVYLNKPEDRGFFHIVGHQKNDGGVVYSDAVMIDYVTG